jgi:hypothetical protein
MKKPPKLSFKMKLWSALEPAVIILLHDIILWLIIFAGLAIVFWGLSFLKLLGVSETWLNGFEKIHLLGSLIIAVLFVFDMVMKTVILLWRNSKTLGQQ